MKKIVIAIAILLVAFQLSAQDKYSFSAKVGSGISMSTPSATPFTFEVLGHYNLTSHWAFGAGTGYEIYDNLSLIPLYANVKYTINPKATYNLFADCSAGYAIAMNKDSNGGFYFNPEFGIQRKLWNKTFLIAVGYGFQELERLKSNSDNNVSSQFVEVVGFHSISLKLGVIF